MKRSHQIGYLISAIFLFSLFLLISYLSPLAGDDWGYAVNGQLYNPFSKAIEFYFNWSGRFFSELYGFLVTPNKWVWNILNPLLFTAIFILIIQLTNLNKKFISIPLVLFLILSVKDELRMETYTWLMGTTYVIPLFLSLLYFNLIKNHVLYQKELSIVLNIINIISLFVIGMSMENISAAVLAINILLLSYYYIQYHKVDRTLLTYTLISILSFTLLRLSPGANLRLMRDHGEWLDLSILDQIVINYPNLIRFTFIENRYLVLFFSLGLLFVLLNTYLERQKNPIPVVVSSFVLIIALISSMSLTLSTRFNISQLLVLTDPSSLFNAIFWPVFTLNIFYILLTCLKREVRLIAIFLLLLAGMTNGAMLLSPIFSYRSSLYTVYFVIALTSLLYQQLNLKWLRIMLTFVLFTLSLKTSLDYYNKYRFVQRVTELRQSQIDYYVDHPEIKEAWLVRYPSYSIHSGDIEEWDVYHMDVFRRYFKINDDVRLVFYNEDWNKIGQ